MRKYALLAALAGAATVGTLGLATDALVLRRLAGVSNDYTLIATFAILLLCVWAGRQDRGLQIVQEVMAVTGENTAETIADPVCRPLLGSPHACHRPKGRADWAPSSEFGWCGNW